MPIRPRVPRAAGRSGRRGRRRRDGEAYLEDGEEPDEEILKAPAPQGHHRTTRSCRCCAAPRSRTRACSRCWTRSSTSCRRRRRRGDQGRAATIDEDDEVERNRPTTSPFAALAFKIMTDPFVGNLTFVRVYSGTCSKPATDLQHGEGQAERIGRMLQMHSNNREEIKEARAGDIVAIGRPEGRHHRRHAVRSGRSRSFWSGWSSPIRLSRSRSSRRRRPTRRRWASRCSAGAGRPVVPRRVRPRRAGQTIISGMGELHLDIIVDRMKREFKVEANVGKPQVAYRETITRKSEQKATSPARSRPVVRASSRGSR